MSTADLFQNTTPLAALLKALADPLRLRIFNLLMEGVHCNCELAAQLDVSLSLISHHLRVLREVGLVTAERDAQDARWIYYTVNSTTLSELAAAMQHLLDAQRIQPRIPACGPDGCTVCPP